MLIHPPTSLAPDFIDYPYWSDLGTVQLAACIRQSPEIEFTLVHSFDLRNSNIERRGDGRWHLGAPVEEVVRASPSADVTIIAVSPFHRPPGRDDTLGTLIEGLKKKTSMLWLVDAYQSGQHYIESDDLRKAYPEADIWIKYEAERTTMKRLTEVLSGKRPQGVFHGEQPTLDMLPNPAWDLVDLDALDSFHSRVDRALGRSSWAYPVGGRTLPLVTTRGCPFRCVHCSSNPDRRAGEPKTQRRYSRERLSQYLSELVEVHGAKRFAILDELINVHPRHFDSVLELIESLDVRFDVPNGFRADYLKPKHFARMRGRTYFASVSAESASKRVLEDVVDKQLDLRAIDQAAEHAYRAGVPLMIHYIIGLPGETGAEVNETLNYALDLWDRFRAYPAVQFATPLPGTRLAKIRIANKLELHPERDWGPHFQKNPLSSDQLSTETLHAFLDTFQKRLRESSGAKKLIMNVTYMCNNHCNFCAVGTRTQIDGHPTRQREFLEHYRQMGVDMVDFDGGEPSLNPELVPLIRYAKRIGYRRIHVTTNGRLCAYESYAQKLVESGITSLLFSVHGHDRRTHAHHVGVAEAFDQTCEGIQNCVSLSPPEVDMGMNITLTKHNYTKMQEVAELSWKLGLRWLNVQFLTPFGRATKELAPDMDGAAAETMRLIDVWHERMKLQVINLPFCFMPGYEQYVEGDLSKLSRHMLFVNNESVNLSKYLAERRTKKDVCARCPHACFCGGFYELEDVPEPEWIVTKDSLLRRPDETAIPDRQR
ncbi:MAG: radical SAM protein [Myxococcota bacterium]